VDTQGRIAASHMQLAADRHLAQCALDEQVAAAVEP
jgi:hypothetical protein